MIVAKLCKKRMWSIVNVSHALIEVEKKDVECDTRIGRTGH